MDVSQLESQLELAPTTLPAPIPAYGESNGKGGGVVGTGKGSAGNVYAEHLQLHCSTGLVFSIPMIWNDHGISQHAPSLEVAAPLFQPTARRHWKGVV